MDQTINQEDFLTEINEIKQELDFKTNSPSPKNEPEILEKELEENEIKPQEPEEEEKEEDLAEKEIFNLLNSDVDYPKKFKEFIERVKLVAGDNLTGRLAIIERLALLFGPEPCEMEEDDPPMLLGDMENYGLKGTLAYRRLFEQVDLLKEAEERLRAVLGVLEAGEGVGGFEGENLKNLKLRYVLSESGKRVGLERVLNEVVFMERLPKNGIFSKIRSGYNHIKQKIDEMKALRQKLTLFFEKYPKRDFKRFAIRYPKQFEKANLEYKSILLEYSKMQIKDEKIETNFWCLETGFKAGLIIAKRRRVEIPIIEKILKSLDSPDMNPYNLRDEIKERILIATRLFKWAKRLKSKEVLEYEQVKQSVEEYREICPNILVKGAYEYVKKHLIGVEEIIQKANTPMFIGELKNLKEELKVLKVSSLKTLRKMNKRIRMGEELLGKVKKMSDEEISRNFADLKEEYQSSMIKINRFEEILQIWDVENYLVQNVESIVEEDGSLDKIREMRDKVKKFQFCRYCEIELFLLNKEIEYFMREFDMISENREFNEAKEIFLTRHGLCISDLEAFESQLRVLRDKIREEIHYQRMRKSKRGINCDMMQRESEKLQKHLLFLRSLYSDSDNTAGNEKLKSGKTSVFEKSLETFLENYRNKDKRKSDKEEKAPKLYNRYEKNPKSELEQRNFAIGKLRRLLERVTMLKVEPADVPFVARSIEKGIFVKLIDKSMYLKVMARVLAVIREIRNNKYVEISRYIRKQDYRSKIFLKLSQKPVAFLKTLNDKLVNMKLNRKKSKFANKYLKPFEDPGIIQKKIKKRKKKKSKKEKFKKIKKISVVQDTGFLEDFEGNEENFKPTKEGYNGIELSPKILKKKKTVKKAEKKSFCYYNIFQGKISLDLLHTKRKTEMSLFSCVGEDFIKHFSKIPQRLTLSTKLSRRDFDNYINKALIVNQRKYLVLPGFIEAQNTIALKSEMENRSLVMSMSYTKKCKIFIFPKNFIQSQWLDVLNVIIIKKPESRVELVYFLVLKLTERGNEERIVPNPIKLEISGESTNELRPFLLKKTINEVVEEEIDFDSTKKKITESAKMLKKSLNHSKNFLRNEETMDNSIKKKFDFEEELKKIKVQGRMKKSKKSNKDFGEISTIDTSGKKPKNKLEGLFSNFNNDEQIQNFNENENFGFQDEAKPKEESIGYNNQESSHLFESVNYSRFDNEESKFEGMFEANTETIDYSAQKKYGEFEIMPEAQEVKENLKFSEDEEIHDLDQIPTANDFLDVSNVQMEVENDDNQGNFVESFNAIMDQQLKDLGQDFLEDKPLEARLPMMGSLEGFEQPMIGQEKKIEGLISEELINNQTIEEPFKNVTNHINILDTPKKRNKISNFGDMSSTFVGKVGDMLQNS